MYGWGETKGTAFTRQSAKTLHSIIVIIQTKEMWFVFSSPHRRGIRRGPEHGHHADGQQWHVLANQRGRRGKQDLRRRHERRRSLWCKENVNVQNSQCHQAEEQNTMATAWNVAFFGTTFYWRNSPKGNVQRWSWGLRGKCMTVCKDGQHECLPEVKPNHLDHPLVAGCSIGHIFCLLHVSGWNINQTKEYTLNTFSAIWGISYQTNWF